LVLKYAQSNFGVDKIISYDLHQVGKLDLEAIRPQIGEFAFVKNVGTTKFENILFVGVPYLDEFGYKEIREFTKEALKILSVNKPDISHIAMTIHGAGYGLDENEAIISQFAGLFEALQSGHFPKKLQKVSIIENNHERLTRLRKVIDRHLAIYKIVERNSNEWTYSIQLGKLKTVEDNIIEVAKVAETKRHIFVAMPFNDQMSDTFYYGIQKPINDNDFLCERIDKDIFTGDILTKIKNKIETCSAVVADLTQSNPNVYLEVGYAWGIGKPTVLIVKEDEKLKFDVQGQRCLVYKNIKHLEDLLTKEIKGLTDNGEIK
jgi:DNA-binding cell septation regulator SpoVG